MPVYNGHATVDRAVTSVRNQTFADWELVAVDDCSTDGSYELLVRWAREDDRIRVLRTAENGGPGAARNLALGEAQGEFVAYLDCDDEFYPDYLESVARFRSKGDVLIFRYDYESNDAETKGQVFTWDPAEFRDYLFAANPTVPLGVAHRRELMTQAGEFDERPWFQEDWDFWKRLGRTGAVFLYLPFKSGLYHCIPTSLTQSPRMSDLQRASYMENRERHDRLFPGCRRSAGRGKIDKIVFAAASSLIDPSSGAAIATASAMQLLASCGLKCEAFCGTRLDFGEEICIEQVLAELGLPYEVRKVTIGTSRAKIILSRLGNVPVTLFRNVLTQTGPTILEASAFLNAYERFLHSVAPDLVLTYGGDPIGRLIVAASKRRDMPVVFGLHNFGYQDIEPFLHVDYVIVPSQFSRDYYWERLGLHCQVLANVIDPQRVIVARSQPQYLTFVNPQPTKGVYVFARIAEQIARRRPDIPILVVESRDRTKALEQTGLDLSWAKNLFGMANTTDPRKFYAVTKVLLMPSLWNESFGLVAAEAMLNGIPVLASDRGALPETIGDGGHLFPIPARYTPHTTDVPTAEEVEPWIETILRLWDDAAFYRQQSELAVRCSERFHPERLRPLYLDFFSNVHPQPGPPIVLREHESS